MTTLGIDTAGARRLASALVDNGDAHARHAAALRHDVERLDLAGYGTGARLAIESAADESRRAGTFLRLVSDAADGGDRLDVAAVAVLAAVAAGPIGPVTADNIADLLLGQSPFGGDLAGSAGTEIRAPYSGVGADPIERGRALVMRALTDTGDGSQIRPDEFQIVQVAADRFIVVLPGVTDLSSPDLGLSDVHRSVRDLDGAAWSSAWSSDVHDNAYAAMVWGALRVTGVPEGSELMIVGHSFGADTAIDLAADPAFNGDRYRVTHVVAAGYHVDEFVGDVPASTGVLVLQNHRDLPVIAEAVGHSAAADAVARSADAAYEWTTGDIDDAATSAWRALGAQVEAWREAIGFLVDHDDEVVDVAIGVGMADWRRAADAVGDLVSLTPGVLTVGPNVVVDVFEGGALGAGHHPANYVEHLAAPVDPAVGRFLADLDRSGYAAAGTAVAVDISVPHR